MANGWRALLLTVMVLGFVQQCADVFMPNRGSSWLLRDLSQVGTDVYRVDSLDGLRATGQVRVGDLLALEAPRYEMRAQGVPFGATIAFQNQRTHSLVRMTDAPPTPRPLRVWFMVALIIELLSIILVAARGQRPEIAALATFLFFNQYTFPASSGFFFAPIRLTWGYIQLLGTWLSNVALTTLAAHFLLPGRWRRLLVTSAWTAVTVITVAALGSAIADVATGTVPRASAFLQFLIGAIGAASVLVLFFRTIATRQGTERRRVAILAVSMIIGALNSAPGFFGPGLFTAVQSNVSTAATIVMTIGLAYAILVDHVFDIGFAVNRAVVYAITSALVVLAFIAIEWGATKLAAGFGPLQTTSVELALAVVVGLSLRRVHGRVDAVVDHVVFAARHRAANAILRFTDDVCEFRSRDALIAATDETLRLYARAASIAILIADDDGNLSGGPLVLSVDHPVTVRLRTSRVPIDRATFPQLTMADIAFPMTRRRDVTGVILVTLPPRAEPYSPEERDAIALLAREVGAALVALDAADAKRLAAELTLVRLGSPVRTG